MILRLEELLYETGRLAGRGARRPAVGFVVMESDVTGGIKKSAIATGTMVL
jgi:hypothetical protein